MRDWPSRLASVCFRARQSLSQSSIDPPRQHQSLCTSVMSRSIFRPTLGCISQRQAEFKGRGIAARNDGCSGIYFRKNHFHTSALQLDRLAATNNTNTWFLVIPSILDSAWLRMVCHFHLAYLCIALTLPKRQTLLLLRRLAHIGPKNLSSHALQFFS
jgi:hypothetical protein